MGLSLWLDTQPWQFLLGQPGLHGLTKVLLLVLENDKMHLEKRQVNVWYQIMGSEQLARVNLVVPAAWAEPENRRLSLSLLSTMWNQRCILIVKPRFPNVTP